MRKTAKKRLRNKAGLIIFFLSAGLILFAGCDNQRAGRQFEQGKKLHAQGAYLEAIRSWEIILSSWPQSDYADQALHRIGATYYVEMDQQDRALDAFTRLVKDYPKSQYAPEDLVLVADIYRGQREFAKALAEYCRYLQLYPQNPNAVEIRYKTITCLFEVGEYQAMRAQASELIKKFPESPYAADCIFWLGESYYLERDYEKARGYFGEYIKKYPKGEMAYKSWLSYARSLEEDNKLPDAIKTYQDLLKRYPSDKIIQSRLDSAQKRLSNRFDSGKSQE
jgi:TolA-binding protein